MPKRPVLFLFCVIAFLVKARGQDRDSLPAPDTSLRIVNLNPYFSLHVDSLLSYQLSINKDPAKYYWYLKNAPAGLKINKDNGLLLFKVDRSFFLSGKLKYDNEYTVRLGVQNLADPRDKVDTSFTLVFYNTEVVFPKLKPTVAGTLFVEEGQKVSFKVQCETGNFPIDEILFTSDIPIQGYSLVKSCDDEFDWVPPFDFVKETDSGRVKILHLNFIGTSSRFKVSDTASLRIVVKDALDYPMALMEYQKALKSVQIYILQLKYTFLQLDKRLRKTKTARTSFDLTSATTALTGTVLSTANTSQSQTASVILPSVGVALVPVKEAAAPTRVVEQNQASLVRASIKRLEYMLFDNALVGDKDPTIVAKTSKLKDELKQSEMQLIDIPVDITSNMSEQQLNDYFNNPKVNKKYRLKSSK